jgi:L-ascorbate metabolism protein UlaG (beta-lactamase superfamily)
MKRMMRIHVQSTILLILLALAGCSGSDSDDSQNQGARVALSEWAPLSPARFVQVSGEVQAARDRILGPGATDPRFVKLWWFGVSSFIASAGGHLFFFDAWEIVGLHADYVPIGREELAALKPEAILVGHGHFDHAADVGYVAGRSGAVVVGSEEICEVAKEDAARDGNENNFRCLITGSMDTPTPGTIQSVRLWADLPPVHILQHIHSAATPELQDPGVPFIHIPDLATFLLFLNTDPQETATFIPTLADPQGGTWAYHIRVGDFSLLWHDSAGPINDGNPSAEEVQRALNSFPGCVDVQVGAIVGFNQPVNGLRDPRLYVQHSHPRVSLPSHHDAWAPVVGGGAAGYESAWRAEIASLEHPPELDYLRDPEDYLQVRSYRVNDPIWSVPMPGSSCAR